MLGNAASWVGLAMVVFGGACVPGAIAPRKGAATDAAANAARGEVVVGRDAGVVPDAARAGKVGPSEMPKLQRPDAAGSATEDAAGDAPAPHEDATSQEVRLDVR